jgi:hypothetical protein
MRFIATLSMTATLISMEGSAEAMLSPVVTAACGAMAAVAEEHRRFAEAVSVRAPLAELPAGVMRAGLNRADGPASAVAAALMAAVVDMVVAGAANRGLNHE